MTIFPQKLLGDCRLTLQSLAPGSAHTCITSPPYYGLRAYNTPPVVWPLDSDCDPFAGTSTTGEVATRLGRHSVMCELSPEYFEAARQRDSQGALTL